jgi:hypothetical protein
MANDNDGMSKSADHIGPGAYVHPEKLCLYTLMLATPWRRGQHILESKYSWITPILCHIPKTQNTSILAPYGQNLVTNSLTGDNEPDEIEEIPSSAWTEGHLPHTPLLQDSTLGMQELEDAAAEVQFRNNHNDLCKGQGTFSNVVQVGGIMMNKSHAITQHF